MDLAATLHAALGGAAPALSAAMALIGRAGVVGWLLTGLSVVAMTLVIAKLWQFASSELQDNAPQAALAALRSGMPQAAAPAAQACGHPAARALAVAIEGQRRALPPEMVREAAWAAGEAALAPLRSWLRPLEVIAALAPLIGLFGTVLGMIEAFAALERAGSAVDPALLSGGIWTALLTTAMGLGVAMPVVAALAWFERRIERAEAVIDATLAAAFTLPLWSTEGPSEVPHGRLAAQV